MSISIAPAPAGQVAGSGPAWRRLLEARWHQRLSTLTELSLAYHDAVERAGGGYRPPAQAGAVTPQVRRLLRDATAARCALRDTEEALTRLSDGSYGECEQCSAPISAAELLAEPEARYCAKCVQGRADPGSENEHDGEGPAARPPGA